jgi:hypothetical protein
VASLSNTLVVLCNESGQFLTYRSDAHGFNNPPDVWDSAPIDVAAVGDSFTQGYCVENSFVNLIRKRHHATLNLGMEGNGGLVMLATIKEYARVARPKVVLWFYFEGNDLQDLSRERQSSLLQKYLTKGFSQNLFSRQSEIDRALGDYLETVEVKSSVSIKLAEVWALLRNLKPLQTSLVPVIKLSEMRQRLGMIHGTNIQANPGAPLAPNAERAQWARSQTDLLYEILLEAKREVEEWGGQLYFVYLPTYQQYAPGNEANTERDDVLSLAGKAGLPVIDIHQTFRNHEDPLALFPFRLAGHYNEEGHRLVAEAVLGSISVGK